MGIFGKKAIIDDSSARVAELEKQLREYKERLSLTEYELETVNRSAHLGLWRVRFDETGNISEIDFTDEFRRLLGGYTRDELRNDVESYGALMHPEDAGPVNKLFADSVADKTGRIKFDIDYRLVCHH